MTARTTITRLPPGGGPAPGRVAPRARGRRPTFVTMALGLPVAFMAIVYAYPVGKMLMKSVTEPKAGFGNFTEAATDSTIWDVLWVTVRLSLEVAVLTVVLGFPVAYFLARTSARKARFLSLLVVIPFWTSILVRSFAWIVLLGDNGLVTKVLDPLTGDSQGLLYSESAVVIAMTHILLPFPILIIKGTLDQIDASLPRAARSLGAGPVRAFVQVYLPLAVPAIVSSGMLVFVIGLGFYVTPALVGGPKQSTIAVVIAQNVQVNFDWGMAATLATMLLVLATALTLVVRRLTKVKGLVSL
ncbi:ABC transporter permease [Actinomadura sp. NEAU-AAG7]|uniref:ABC transporter permease n=1 Tax=Actinomadura sp. NEAU-AAG7 TaxID=2839640 RepID=UPI001BE4D2AD|nr:ABC transporter permease [Actinomadura sp. NEAU-AAG7]MBT2207863.1 ABC transporter permease [Actinomadura sp. NEAU-AAG7]